MGFDTALTIISDASTELGLGAVSDAFGSTDANVLQMCALLKSSGRKVRQARNWKQLQRAYTFLTATNQGRYGLPLDYGRYLSDTTYNRTTRLPAIGPLSPASFQMLKARVSTLTYNILFRVLQGNFQAYPDTSTQGSWVIAYEYTSSFWVTPSGTHATSGTWNNATAYSAGTYIENGGRIYHTTAGGTSGTYGPIGTGTATDGSIADWAFLSVAGADAPTANGDTVNFDSRLMSRALKLAWLEAKNMDTTAASADYNDALLAAGDDDSQGQTLYVSGGAYREPLLSARNFPDTGFGQ